MKGLVVLKEEYHRTQDPEEAADLREQIFWAALVDAMTDGPTASLLRLFADIKGWTKSAGESGTPESTRISPEEARSLFGAFLNAQGQGDGP